MADRIVTGTLDTFSVDSGSDVTYKGAGVGNDTGLSQRAFLVNPSTTGDITVSLDRSAGVISMEIFQDDDHSAGSAPTGYKKAFNVDQVQQYVYVPLNRNRKAAVLSFAYSLGILGFKNSRLLELINSHASKRELIKEWSPYINKYWLSGGELMRDRRRTELNTYFAADVKIPSFVRHDCHTSVCLLNLPETYTGSPSQIKAVEYLEKKIKDWDPSGHVIRRFYRLWSTPPRGLGNQERPGQNALEDQ